MSSSNNNPPTTGQIDVNDAGDNNQHSEIIRKKFKWALKQVERSEQDDGGGKKRKISEGTGEDDDITKTGGDASLSEEELVGLIRQWQPQRDIICLYVRWGRQLRRNFNLDSIATLLSLSRQCGYKPFDFLPRVKTLSIHPYAKASYGVTFHFAIASNRKDVDEEKLNKEFLGLSVTLALLQEQVTESPSILGKTGMRQSGPRTAKRINVCVDWCDEEEEEGNPFPDHFITAHPTTEFHTPQGLLNRIWVSMSHRWAALFLLEHLFRGEEKGSSWSYVDALVYSFQMMAPCGPGRYEFLLPLVGYCLRFANQESIISKRNSLRDIQKNPSLFLKAGDDYAKQKSPDAKAQVIISCFKAVHESISQQRYHKLLYYRKTPWLTRWNMLRAYIFHFWLESVSNADLKSSVVRGLSLAAEVTPTKKKKLDVNQQHELDIRLPYAIPQVGGSPSGPAGRKEVSNGPPLWLNNDDTEGQTAVSRTSDTVEAVDVDVAADIGTLTLLPVNEVMKNVNWTTMRLISQSELCHSVKSYLVIHRQDGSDIVSELSPLEVYSAKDLHDLTHSRMSGKPPYFPQKEKLSRVTLRIEAEAEYYIDASGKTFHISRKGSESFDEHSQHLPPLTNIQDLCQAIVEHGVVDEKRAAGQYRMNIGNGGLNWVNGAPCLLHGMKFEESLRKDNRFNSTEILQTIGRVTEFSWYVASSLQEQAADPPMAPDTIRKQMYARHLNEYLSMDNEVGFEDLTLVVSSLHPVIHSVRDHKDVMNDTLSGYTRTVAFNMVLIDDHNRDHTTVLHFQVIGNFRKVIGDYVVSFRQYVSPVANHARQYMDKWNRRIYEIFGGRTKKRLPTVYDRTSFFLDDMLPYTTIRISEEGKHKATLHGEYLLSEVGISRTMSLSMFIDPIVKLQAILKTDQLIELVLACSYLSNPFWFDRTMTSLLQRIEDEQGTFRFQLHPFYDWSTTTIETFGTWQGGPHNRWSPCGGNKESILETFGAHPDASKEEKDRGERRLSRIVSILWDYMQWINALQGKGSSPIQDMPLGVVRKAYDVTIKRIADVVSCQFSHFRLGILTTILSGCGLLKPGSHLRHLMFPAKGTASYRHLSHPVADVMSKEKAYALGTNELDESVLNDGKGCVEEEHHDSFMMHLSSDLGFQIYCRDEMECILCESHPMRSLCCRDWFRKGGTLYDCDTTGNFFRKEYGQDTEWIKMKPPEYMFAYLGTTTTVSYVVKDSKLAEYASQFGQELRDDESVKRLRINGRMSKTSSYNVVFNDNSSHSNRFCHTSVQSADFYVGSVIKSTDITSFFVLGDGENAVASETCNDFDDFRHSGLLLDYLSTLSTSTMTPTEMAAARYHRDPGIDDDGVSFFPGHIDKAFVHSAWFVPVGTASFFTLVAVPRHFQATQNEYSTKTFENWMKNLSRESRQKVDDFIVDFDAQAKKVMKQEDTLDRLIVFNECGSLLRFPANICYHATITPRRTDGKKRDVLIIHPLDGIGRVTT